MILMAAPVPSFMEKNSNKLRRALAHKVFNLNVLWVFRGRLRFITLVIWFSALLMIAEYFEVEHVIPFSFLFFSFEKLDSCFFFSWLQIQEQYIQHGQIFADLWERTRLFRTQRNWWISLFNLFIWITLMRYSAMLDQYLAAQEELETLRKKNHAKQEKAE